jgi:hypothetical protein
MSEQKIVQEFLDAVDTFNECDAQRSPGFVKAVRLLDDLEKKGLVENRGSTLLPIEKRHRLALEYRGGGE